MTAWAARLAPYLHFFAGYHLLVALLAIYVGVTYVW